MMASSAKRNAGWIIFWVTLVFALPAASMAAGKAADPATTRLALYRAETYAVLLKHHWHIVSDQLEKLVAEQPCATTNALSGPGIYVMDFARLTIKFTAQTATHTRCDALIQGYAHGTVIRKDAAGNRYAPEKMVGPFPLDTPDTKKEIQEMMAEAEKRLEGAYSEYAAH